MTESIKLQLASLPALSDLQSTCPEVKLIKSGDKPKNAKFEERLIDNLPILCEISSLNKPRPFVPKEMRQQIINSLHQMDHLGIKPTRKRVGSEHYCPTLKADVEEFVKKCNTCKKVRPANKLINTGEFKVPDKRFSHVMVDIVGPLPISQGYRFLLTCLCRSTRMFRAIPLREASSQEAASAFLHGWLSLHGVPSQVTSDNGASFAAKLWKDMMDKLNIQVKYSALYRPQAVGMLERQHRSLKDSLKAAIEDMGNKYQDKWMD